MRQDRTCKSSWDVSDGPDGVNMLLLEITIIRRAPAENLPPTHDAKSRQPSRHASAMWTKDPGHFSAATDQVLLKYSSRRRLQTKKKGFLLAAVSGSLLNLTASILSNTKSHPITHLRFHKSTNKVPEQSRRRVASGNPEIIYSTVRRLRRPR